MAQQETIEPRSAAVTASVACAALIVYGWPHLAELLVYDRQAILRGEVWRLFTAPFVHFSWSHICWDLLVYGAAGWVIETAGYRRYRLVCSLAAVIPGPVFLLASPELARYGGLSGLATGAVTFLCLCKTRGTDRNRTLWIALLALMGVKTTVEAITGTPIFVSAGNLQFRVLPAVHAFGCAAALAAFIWTWPAKALHSNAAGLNRGAFRQASGKTEG